MKARIITSKALSFAAAAAMVFGCAVSGAGFTASAYDGEYDNYFTFTDTEITAENEEGSGFKIEGTDLTINEAGVYVVSGECAEGTVKVKKGTEGVTLVLSDLHLTSTTSAPISVNKTSEATIVIEGENVITDLEDPANEDSEDPDIADAFEGAAIKVKSGANVTFTGTGTLTADGSACKNGIKGGSEANITVGASDADSFTLNVKAANNALASDGTLTINGGSINVESADDGIKASPDDDDEVSLGLLNINGGTVSVTAADDAVHGENVNVSGGNITVNAGDDGIKAEYVLKIGSEGTTGPVINIEKSNEGLEGATVNLYSGSGRIISDDDGINAANSDLQDYSYALNIYGGSWYINAGGDGLDSNGDLNVSGGYTEVFGAENGGNAALDYGDFGSSFNYTGGTIAGVGYSQMAGVPTSGYYIEFGGRGGMGQGGMHGGQVQDWQQGEQGERPEMPEGEEGQFPGRQQGEQGERPELPEGEEGQFPGRQQGEKGERPELPEGEEGQFPGRQQGEQGGMMPGQQGGSAITISANDLIEIRDAEGAVLYSATAPKSADHIVYASAELDENAVYYLYINDTLAAASDGSEVNAPAAQPAETEQQPASSEDTSGSQQPADSSDAGSTDAAPAASTTTARSLSANTGDNPSTGAAAASLGLGSIAAALLAIFSRHKK